MAERVMLRRTVCGTSMLTIVKLFFFKTEIQMCACGGGGGGGIE